MNLIIHKRFASLKEIIKQLDFFARLTINTERAQSLFIS